ncbi:MAG: Na+:solute symporter [Candidatus Latescibacteria bacterium]|nr:Na+:solute symporter [Candidatus Latescibacterota bacterium]
MFDINSRLSALDWSVVIIYLILMLIIGLSVSKRAGKSLSDFFVSGRRLTWYLAGASLVATSFASDTPLWVSGLVRRFGVYAAWQYWCPAVGAGLAVFLFAGLWRRLGIITDLEFIEIRYSGKTAAFLRGAYAFWTSLIMNALIMGWVTKAMENILSESLGISSTDKAVAVGIAITIALIYCALAGLWGVVLTDFFQLILATGGTIALAWYSVKAVGGLDVMVEKLQTLPEWPGTELTIGPKIGAGPGFLSIWNAVGFFGLLWWQLAVTNGYNAQRLLATRDERHASFASLFYTMVYWSVNAWPWIIVALCSLILLPGFDGGPAEETAYPHMMMNYLPPGLRGMLFVAMLAAFMSTISTMINWGSSYFVNDFYKRFIERNKSERYYVTVGRLVSVLMAILGGTVAYFADSVLVLIQIGGMLLTTVSFLVVMRWFWWRMNALSELAGFLTSVVITLMILVFKVFDAPLQLLFGQTYANGTPLLFHSDYDFFGLRVILVFIASTAVTVVVAYTTKPTHDSVLADFLRRAHPFKFLWKPVITQLGIDYPERERIREVLFDWLMVTISIYSLLLSIGKFLLGGAGMGFLYGFIFLVTLMWTIRRINTQFGNNRYI